MIRYMSFFLCMMTTFALGKDVIPPDSWNIGVITVNPEPQIVGAPDVFDLSKAKANIEEIVARQNAIQAAKAAKEAARKKAIEDRKPKFYQAGESTYYDTGTITACGCVFDPEAMTAAHRRLPFHTIIKVVNIANGRSVVVKVNDRGPFGKANRILDLSRGAFRRIGNIHGNPLQVKIYIVKMGNNRRHFH